MNRSASIVAGLVLMLATVAADDQVYRPTLAVSELLQPFLPHLEPGSDAFATEKEAAAIDARLAALSQRLRSRADVADTASRFLAPGFRGGRILDADASQPTGNAAFEVKRALAMPDALTFDGRAFAGELRRLLAGMRRVSVAEFLVTSIDAADASGLVRTTVRFDVVGEGEASWRIEHVGNWRLGWRESGTTWQIAEWVATSHTMTRAAAPIFTEITQSTLAGNDSFRRQLSADLDAWMSRIDSVLTRDSNGHHGVSVGDADGDGIEDLYVAQPAGLPNRLFRGRGDSTFEDITDRAGLGVLDDTAQSLFADVDNDNDQDLVLATGTRPLLFLNDGKARFTRAPDAFRFSQPLQGVLTSIAMADYDRDGFLDLYLCVYSYFFGAGEDKAGTPAPYYDARNGPPGVLFRNNGRGQFVEVTAEAGLGEGNDRYHFAAAWADYDGDGWQDLLVANDFGTKNLYRNRGRRGGVGGGTVTFEDVSAAAGVLDHGAGMSAAFLDYDNDGLLDIYTGNMWSANGLRITTSPAFMPDAPAEMRALYRRHARGNSLFRNRGDGSFDEKTLEARAEMGRWAWSSDALDFDSDGFEDLYIVNGMLTREGSRRDLDGFFWRQVVSRSPLTRVKGTPYDDAWRAINQLLMHESIASRQRNVFLRNDGVGGFDDVSGAIGLDLDQDGRSFAVLDLEHDGDPDLVLMAARQAPQLRVFRNDYAARGASLAVRLVATTSNRDAIGARVTVETDRVRRTKIVQAGSGFLSQHSKELHFGLGASTAVRKLTVVWPSGETQVVNGVEPNARIRIVEGGAMEKTAFATTPATPPPTAAPLATPALPDASWLYEPFPAPDFSSLAALKGKPAVLLFHSSKEPAPPLAPGTLPSLAIAIDTAAPEVALSYAIAHRALFMNRQDMRLPAAMLLDTTGRIVKIYRGRIDAQAIVRDAASIDVPSDVRLARALPFPGSFEAPLPVRNYLPYGRELLDQGLEQAAIVAFERAAQANPSASTLYRLGTLLAKSGEAAGAKRAFERALTLQPTLAEANNDLGALLAQGGDLDAAIARFRAALTATPEYPDALNNLGYALLLSGREDEARALYEKALALQPDFPEALNNLGLLFGRAGDLDRADRYFRDALARRPDYGEAANNLALVLVARGESEQAVELLEGFLKKVPAFESAYITLAKIHFQAERSKEGLAVLERLLQRNAQHPVALELVKQLRPR